MSTPDATTRTSARRASSSSAHRRHFYFGIADGVKADFMHFRQCDARLNAQGGRKTASAYDAIGAAQVAKASFSGMRLLHRLDGKVAIWPMDPLPEQRQRGGRNLHPHLPAPRRDDAARSCAAAPTLNRALEGLGSPPARLRFEPNDHQTDALVTAAGMRAARADRAARLRSRGPDARDRAKRRLDVRRAMTQRRARAGLAQLVEQRFCKPKVAGSKSCIRHRDHGDYSRVGGRPRVRHPTVRALRQLGGSRRPQFARDDFPVPSAAARALDCCPRRSCITPRAVTR